MKKLFTFFMLALFVSLSLEGFAQTAPWVWQHETPQGNTLRYVKYWDANNWYALGYNGTFMKTTNAGANWTWKNNALGQYSNSGQANWCYGAYFFNQNTGLILGQGNSTSGANGIYRTTNGGTTFDTTNVVPWVSGTFYFAYFVNNNLGFAGCTSAPYIYRTTNGGISWTGLTSPTTTAYDVYASDSLNIIIANTSGNVRRSTDGGATWTTVLTGASATLYRMVFANANTGFTAGGSTAATMFRYTTNGGLNWTTPANTGLGASTMYDIDVQSVSAGSGPLKLDEGFEGTFPPTGWSTIHVLGTTTWVSSTSQFHSGAQSAFITYETAGAENWLVTKKVTGISATDSLVFWWKNAFSSAYPPDSLIIRVSTTDSLQGSFTNVVARIDASATPYTWTRFAYSLGSFSGQNVFIAFQQKNTDGNGGYLDDVQILPAPAVLNATIYMTGNSFYIYKTTNTGATWDTVGFLSPTQPWTSTFYATDLSPYGGDTLLTVGAFGFINRRAGSNFTEYTNVQKPGANNDVWAQSSTGNVLVVGSPTSAGSAFDQIMKSTNGGTTWTIVPYSTTSRTSLNCIQMLDANTGYVCGTLGALYRTTNGGSNWDSIPVEGSTNSAAFRKVDFINANTGWLFTTFTATITDSATIFKTTNAGVNWTKQYIPASTASNRGVYGADMIDANTGWLVSYQPRPWRTTNGGNTWTIDSISDGFSGYMNDIKMFSATNGYIAGSSGRFYKLNSSNIWDTVSVPSRNFSFNGLDFVSPSAGYLFGSSGVCYATTNSGNTWTSVNTQGSTMNNGYITPDFKAFCVGASGQIFKNNNVLTNLAGNTDPLIPTKYSLEQNYPNPFNPTTTIKFGLPKDGMVTLKVYDVAGREVMRLIDNQTMKAGFQTHFFNASSLASGVYFYSLTVNGNMIGTKKMVLIK